MNITEEIKNTPWYKQAGNSKAYYIFTCCRAAMRCLDGELGIWALTNGNYLEAFLPKERFISGAKLHLESQKKNPTHIVSIMQKCEDKSKPLYDYYNELNNIKQMTLKKVKKALKKLDKLNYDYWCCSYHCDLYDPNGEELLARELKMNHIDLSESELNVFMKSNWKNYIQEERISLLNLKKKNITSDEAPELIEHTWQFFYVDNSWESTVILTKEDFFKRLNSIKETEANAELERLNKNWDAEHIKLQKRYSIPRELMNVFFYFRQLFIMRDKRKKHTLLTNHYYDQLMMRLSELTKMSFKDMRTLLIEEVIGSVGDIKELASLRKNLVLEIYCCKKETNGLIKNDMKSENKKKAHSEILSGGNAVTIFNLLQKNYSLGGSLRGRGASKGKATGIARVILGETHFSKFNDGEIIIAPMTRPEFVPLMRKASAIVTDEGGITCHAAIVSRELGKPCIVGTQKATSILKDGMLIEVDADKGIVKVIKHMKLVTVQSLVDKELEKHPDIISILKQRLLNITAAAEKFRPLISQQMGKEVKIHAISMAIRRYSKRIS